MPRRRDRIDPSTGEILGPGEYPSGARTLYVIRPFRQHDGELVALPDLAQENQYGAIGEAEIMVALGKWDGAVVVRQTSDPEAGDYREPELVATVGRVPDDLIA